MLMTIADIRTRQGNSTFAYGGAQLRAYCRHLATVVTIRGELDAGNADQIGEHLRRFVLGESPVVLDMSEVHRLGAPGHALLAALDEQCRAAGLEWVLVAGPAGTDVLGDDGAQARFPIADSVRQALHHLADGIAGRRQLMLPLVRKTA
ncbi:STAS domain-containing protein [Mycobacterium helveticum]|uniref:STAS domain-containing protein n=2 Tax=Mycobacterium helveticum TaxID=2592811 RepID=A0A557XGA7_9MYCO|nr:STAS domain-containing protein [Mycobacterium helveticum]TVS84679.1 STAS domain-containing protein [Mycobacterium helveticum]